MRRFQPVHLPEDRKLDGKLSATFLMKFDACRRDAFLYRLHDGGPVSHAMLRGSALHLILQRSINAAIEQGEPMIPPEVVKAIADEVLADIDCPVGEHDLIREMSYRWAAQTTFDPSQVCAVETLCSLDVGSWQVRGKVDYAELLEGGAAVRIRDWKSSRSLPSFEDMSRKRPDGTLAAKSMQLILYALLVAFGVPVRVEPCAACSGKGFTVEVGPGASMRIRCPECGGFNPLLDVRPQDRTPGMAERMGRGYREIAEPFPLAGRAQRFDLEFVYPAVETRDGRMATRSVSLTRLELGEYRQSLEGMLRRVEQADRDGDWPAVPGSHCSMCTASALCPIPAELRDHAGSINSIEQAQEAAAHLDRVKARASAVQTELKNFAKAHGVEIRYGADKAWRFVYSESERIVDKDGMFEAMQRAVDYGEPFERSQFVKPTSSTTFKPVTLTAEELAEEREMGEAA